ncbi:hypothetical protein [Actinacidiphila rubida]|uniref:Small integral membrane protein n=1 Tax=Actinacidiphila rubida TaxID=310780 RepID=A0A1H8EL17_9ACTN|nr:hypothetical protein [Actinacidiphila rubida]SEN20179.1 hypothetical protein SAMN05216267_1002265 [Actinacidiphila rubida]
MRSTTIGLMSGMALGFAAYFGGFGAFVVVAVLGVAGLALGFLVRAGGPGAGYLREREDDLRRGLARRGDTPAGGHTRSGGSQHRVRVR